MPSDGPPRAAIGRFPFTGHRTVAELDAMDRGFGSDAPLSRAYCEVCRYSVSHRTADRCGVPFCTRKRAA